MSIPGRLHKIHCSKLFTFIRTSKMQKYEENVPFHRLVSCRPPLLWSEYCYLERSNSHCLQKNYNVIWKLYLMPNIWETMVHVRVNKQQDCTSNSDIACKKLHGVSSSLAPVGNKMQFLLVVLSEITEKYYAFQKKCNFVCRDWFLS